MEGVWTLRGISNLVTFHSFWEMYTRKYSGFLRYNLRTKTVSVYLNPYGGANGLIVLTRYDHVAANYLTRVKLFIQTATQDVTVNRRYCYSSWSWRVAWRKRLLHTSAPLRKNPVRAVWSVPLITCWLIVVFYSDGLISHIVNVSTNNIGSSKVSASWQEKIYCTLSLSS